MSLKCSFPTFLARGIIPWDTGDSPWHEVDPDEKFPNSFFFFNNCRNMLWVAVAIKTLPSDDFCLFPSPFSVQE